MNTPDLVHYVDGHDFPCKGEGCQFCACGDNPARAKAAAGRQVLIPPADGTVPLCPPTPPSPKLPENPDVFPRLEGLWERDGSGTLNAVGGADGLTLRDLFAGLAMAGLSLAGTVAAERAEVNTLCKAAYLLADGMLLARQIPREGGAS